MNPRTGPAAPRRFEFADVMAADGAYGMHFVGSDRSWSFPRHAHRGFCEFVYVRHGAIEHLQESSRLRLEAGDLALVREDDIHELRGSRFSFCNLNVPNQTLRAALGYLGRGDRLADLFTRADPPVHRVPEHERDRIETQLRGLFSHLGSQGGGLLLRRFLIEALTALAQPSRALPDRPSSTIGIPSWLQDLVASLEDDRIEALHPSEMAVRTGKSPEHLARSFRAHLGTTPTLYANRIRLHRAALRLVHTNEPILDACLAAGFADLAYFYRVFKRAYGMTPRQYRLAKTPPTWR
jgi:AraC-like DNA-binding protein